MELYKWNHCEVSIMLYNNQFIAESFETEATEIIKAENLLDFIKDKKVRYTDLTILTAIKAIKAAEAAERAAVKVAIEEAEAAETVEEEVATPAPRKRFANGWQPGDWFCYNNDGQTEKTQLNRQLRPESHGNSKPKDKKCFNRKHLITKQTICFTMWSDEEA